VQVTTIRKGRGEPSWKKPSAGKCSGVLGGWRLMWLLGFTPQLAGSEIDELVLGDVVVL
jgi:hypothetical protein